jgi:hypothetical protein
MADPTEPIPTFRQALEGMLGFQLPHVPMPQTLRNLDKAAAALVDIPTAYLEGKAAGLRISAEHSNMIESALGKAMQRRLRDASNEKIAVMVEGVVADYLEKRRRRERVLEIATEELTEAQPTSEATGEIDDGWMAFFKGQIDHLGTEDARVLFGKVLAGEIKHPGSFSKRSLTILSQMDADIAKLFETLCNMSAVISVEETRVLTLGLDDNSGNNLKPFGVNFGSLMRLHEAGLIVPPFSSSYPMPFAALGYPFEIGGRYFKLEGTNDRSKNPDVCTALLSRMEGVAFSAAGRELSAIVSKIPLPQYIEKLSEGFAKRGFHLEPTR